MALEMTPMGDPYRSLPSRAPKPNRHPLIGLLLVGGFTAMAFYALAMRGDLPLIDLRPHAATSPAPAPATPRQVSAPRAQPPGAAAPPGIGVAAAAAAEPGDAPAPAVPVFPKGKLVKPLHDSLDALLDCGHDTTHATDAAWRSRATLQPLEDLVDEYRRSTRTPDRRAGADRFLDGVEAAHTVLSRAAVELGGTALAPAQGDGALFRKSDSLIAQAKKDLAAVDSLAGQAP